MQRHLSQSAIQMDIGYTANVKLKTKENFKETPNRMEHN